MCRGVLLGITVKAESVFFRAVNGGSTEVLIYDQRVTVDEAGIELPLAEGMTV